MTLQNFFPFLPVPDYFYQFITPFFSQTEQHQCLPIVFPSHVYLNHGIACSNLWIKRRKKKKSKHLTHIHTPNKSAQINLQPHMWVCMQRIWHIITQHLSSQKGTKCWEYVRLSQKSWRHQSQNLAALSSYCFMRSLCADNELVLSMMGNFLYFTAGPNYEERPCQKNIKRWI